MPTMVSKLITHPLLWRSTGFVSSIVGFSCYALSPSFEDLFGHWNPLKIIYAVVASILSVMMLLVKRCSWRLVRSFLLKAHVGFLVLTLTSLYSVLEDRSEEGKVDQKGYFGRVMNLTSTASFALMAMSLSRQLELGFEVGVFNFLLGCFLVTMMKLNLKLAPLAALFCYLLVNIRSFSDFILEMRGRGATQHGHGLSRPNNELPCISVHQGTKSSEEYVPFMEEAGRPMGDYAIFMEAYDQPIEDFVYDMEDYDQPIEDFAYDDDMEGYDQPIEDFPYDDYEQPPQDFAYDMEDFAYDEYDQPIQDYDDYDQPIEDFAHDLRSTIAPVCKF